jgi:signal transduction histidine kinase
MLSGVGHELNNVLAVLMPTVQLMEKRLDAGQPVERADLERLGRVGGHLRTHLRHLLNFGRSEAEPEEILDLRNVVRTTLDLLRVAGKVKHLDVEVDFPDLPLPVKTSRTRLEQVLVNLIGNAADAVSEAGLPEGRLGVRAGLESPSAVWCSIEDHGCGIPEDKLEAIFQPYYTTKPPGRGTGLGLPVVKRLVESYGGSISVKSEPGRGTKVRFELPLFREGDAVSGNEIRDQAGGVEPPPVHDGQVPQPQVGAIAQAPSR